MLEWRRNPTTQAFEEWLKQRREAIVQDLAEGSLLGDNSETVAQRYATSVGRMEEIRLALSFDVDDMLSLLNR